MPLCVGHHIASDDVTFTHMYNVSACLVLQIREQLALYLDRHKDSTKNSYRAGLEKHAKSSTDAVRKRVKEQNKAVVKLTDRLQVLSQWLSEASHLE